MTSYVTATPINKTMEAEQLILTTHLDHCPFHINTANNAAGEPRPPAGMYEHIFKFSVSICSPNVYSAR